MDIFQLSDPQQQVQVKNKVRRRLGSLVAFSDFSEPRQLWEIPHWDVQGVVDKQESLTELYSCLKRLVSGRGNVAADLNRVFCGRFAHANLPHANLWCTEFTKRELEVLTWVGRGLDRKAIADRLHISIRTVDRHRQNIMDKTDIRSELGLSHLAFRWGIY